MTLCFETNLAVGMLKWAGKNTQQALRHCVSATDKLARGGEEEERLDYRTNAESPAGLWVDSGLIPRLTALGKKQWGLASCLSRHFVEHFTCSDGGQTQGRNKETLNDKGGVGG